MWYTPHISCEIRLISFTGWRRCIGCLELQISFRKRATNFRALLRKITSKDKASYDSTPPCTALLHVECHSIKSCNLKFVSPMSQFLSPMSQFESHMSQPIACGVSFNLNLPSQSHWSLFNGTWQKRPRELDHRLGFEIGEMTLQMQKAVSLL